MKKGIQYALDKKIGAGARDYFYSGINCEPLNLFPGISLSNSEAEEKQIIQTGIKAAIERFGWNEADSELNRTIYRMAHFYISSYRKGLKAANSFPREPADRKEVRESA